MKVAVVLFLFGLVGSGLGRPNNAAEGRKDINGAQLLRIDVTTPQALRVMVHIQKNYQLDFFTEPRALGKVDVMAQRWDVPKLLQVIRRLDLAYTILVKDMAKHVEEMNRENEAARAKSGTKMDWVSYHTYDEITAWMEQLTVDYPDIASVTDIGTTFEGRTMKMLKLSKASTIEKEAIFTDGGIHAREWISPATVTYFINQLVTNDDEGFLDAVDFYFLPSINPDGYAYTFDSNRLWRKTRSTQAGVLCIGADPNRNWDYHWMEGGASSNPCAETYAGFEPFSEVEMRNVRDQILLLKPRIYLTFHSYSQLWMYPWGYTSDLPENWEDLDVLANNAVNALTAVYGTRYEVGSSTNTIYIAAGGSDDWALGAGGSEYAYTIELRDTGRYGFELPTDQIIPTGEETYEGFKVVARFLRDNPSKK